MNKKNSVAPLAGKGFVSPDAPPMPPGIKLEIPAELDARRERAFITSTKSDAAPVLMLIVTLAVDIFIGVAIFLALRYMGKMDGLMSFGFAILFVVGFGTFVVLLLSGQLPVMYEILRTSIENLRRISAVRDVALAQTAVAMEWVKAQAAHLELQLIEARNDDKRLALALAEKPAAQSVANQLETYTPAQPPPNTLREQMKVFIAEAINDGASVDGNGKFLVGVPWAGSGSLSKTERERVLEWFRVANASARGGWVIDRRNNAWRVNFDEYPDAAQVVGHLAMIPMPAKQGGG